MKSAIFGLALAAAVASSASATAQTIGLGTTKGGATAQVTAAISRVVTTGSKLKMRPQPMGGTQQYIPIVDAGEMDFGVSDLPQYWMAKTGTGLSNRKYENLILVATMMTFRVGFLVANKSSIEKVSDLRGRRIPYGFKAAPLFQYIASGILANGGLGWDEVTKVPAVGLRQHWNMFKEGKLDGVVAAIGTAAVEDMKAAVPGGVRYISLSDNPEAMRRTHKYYPKSHMKVVETNSRIAGLTKPFNALHVDYMLWTYKGQKDGVVYQVVKTMYENEKALHETSPLWRSHRSKTMARKQGAPYHPAAVKFYKEVGIWPE